MDIDEISVVDEHLARMYGFNDEKFPRKRRPCCTKIMHEEERRRHEASLKHIFQEFFWREPTEQENQIMKFYMEAATGEAGDQYNDYLIRKAGGIL